MRNGRGAPGATSIRRRIARAAARLRGEVQCQCSLLQLRRRRRTGRDAKCGLLSWDPTAPKYFVLAAFCANLKVASTRCATQARLCAPIVLYYSAPPASRAEPRLGPFPCSLTQFMPTLAPPQRGASHRIASPRSAFHLITFAAALRLVATPRSASRNSRLPARRCRFQIPDIKLTSQPTPPALRGRHLFTRGSALHWSGFRTQPTPHRLACLAPV